MAQRGTFSPYVRLERKSPERVLCSIFNTEEEEGRGRVTTPVSSPTNKSFPTSSHVVLGPLVTEASTLGPLVCSLCGKFPNHRDLGDLFGPYYPQEYASTLPRNPPARRALPPQARVKVRHKSMPELVCPAPSQSGECEGLNAPHRLRRRHHSEEGGPTWVSPRLPNPGQKRYHCCDLRTRNLKAEPQSQVEAEVPLLPLDPNELWLHGPCVVWASGVYLLNGHLYGLQEALQVAREMVRFAPWGGQEAVRPTRGGTKGPWGRCRVGREPHCRKFLPSDEMLSCSDGC
uniref:Uncharacterized protein n=1 Tax=Callorhinchus milii TaxID=7868 RepID=A0A4W3GK54_CALMI